MEQQWDITSLMQAAARFPDLVADCPQRIYAILGRYETLRSFVAKAPAGCTPLQYENAQIYTNALLDSFMNYKALYKTIGEQFFAIQGKTLEFTTTPQAVQSQNSVTEMSKDQKKVAKNKADEKEKTKKNGLYPYSPDLTPFESSIKGLSDARIAIRRQMARIVNEVNEIERDPKLATDEGHEEPFQSPLVFETRLPAVDIPARFRRTNPLTGVAIKPKVLSTSDTQKLKEDEQEAMFAPPI